MAIFTETTAVFGISILAVSLILGYVIKSVVPVTSFLYANARIQARSAKLIGEKRWNGLAEAKSMPELINSLRDTDYSEQIEKSSNIVEFHSGVEKSFVESVLTLQEMSPEKVKPLFDAYMMFLESKILKTIYRTRFSKISVAAAREILNDRIVFPIGSINQGIMTHLLNTETAADIGAVLSKTKYAEIFSIEYENLEQFEVALDSFVLNNFAMITQKTKMFESKFIIDILNRKFDILNILALMKAEVRNIPEEKRLSLLINNNTELYKRSKKIVNADGLAHFVELCKGLPFYDALKEALSEYEKDKSMSHFEKSLYRHYKKFVTDLDLQHNLGPYPLFSYLTKKEIEQRNLLAISKGIDVGFNSAEIKELII